MQVMFKMNDRITVTLESKDQKELFEELGNLQEIFGHNECGKCKKTDLKYQVREVDGNKFYDLICKSCGARLAFGSHKKGGTLFPKRKDEEGKYYNNGGWLKWNREKNVME